MKTRSQFLIALALAPSVLGAGSQSGQFQVGAQVLPRATIDPVSAPVRLQVTGADLARGYKDVAVTYRVRSNDRRYALHFDPRVGLTRSIEVRGLSSPVVLSELGTDVAQEAAAPQQEYRLQFRFHFVENAVAGAYALPVVVGVRTL
jgi:hypothetical protein